MATINRILRIAFRDTLARYDIDDLQLEIDLVATAKEALADRLIDETEKSVGAFEALKRHEESVDQDRVDVSHFPEEVALTIQILCELWLLKPPSNTKSSEYSSWIECARSINDACGEHSVERVLRDIHVQYEARMQESLGLPPYVVAGPCSLVKMSRAWAGLIRKEESNEQRKSNQPEQSSFNF